MVTMAELAHAAKLQAQMVHISALRARGVEKAAYQAYVAAHNAALQATADANWAAQLADMADRAQQEEEKSSQIWTDLVADELAPPWKQR